LMNISGTRRAIVFYVDKGNGFLAYLKWWLYAWKLIGLNDSTQAFDIILFTHPSSIQKLPKECSEIEDDFDPKAPGGGRCLYRELVPLSERDFRYDNYLNSQECLFNEETSKFLLKYKILIRADLDTFPTPKLIDYWPEDVICNRLALTNHNLPSIENAIVKTAAAAGIKHNHWHGTDSAWMGPSARIVMLSRLTTYVARFTRAYMFGPGTPCRCASCIDLPSNCTWGSGIYAGSLLLYAQEIAMNRIWTKREFDAMTYAILDGSCTDPGINICTPALLHARHNSDLFSKFSFLRGEYKDMDLGWLDITNVRDFAAFVAIRSAGQGINGDKAWNSFSEKFGTKNISDYCTQRIKKAKKTTFKHNN